MIRSIAVAEPFAMSTSPAMTQSLVSDDTMRLIDIMGLLDEREQEIVLATAMTLMRVKASTMTQ